MEESVTEWTGVLATEALHGGVVGDRLGQVQGVGQLGGWILKEVCKIKLMYFGVISNSLIHLDVNLPWKYPGPCSPGQKVCGQLTCEQIIN